MVRGYDVYGFIGKAGFRAGEDVFLALDVAASELWDDKDGGCYVFAKSGGGAKMKQRLMELYFAEGGDLSDRRGPAADRVEQRRQSASRRRYD